MNIKHIRKWALLLIMILQYSGVLHADNEIDFDQAEQYKKEGNYNKANWIYFSALRKNINVKEAHYGLADSYFRKGEYKLALKEIKQIFKKDKNHVKALSLRSHVFLQQQKWQKALNDIEQLQSLGHDDAELYMQLDLIYSALGDHASAKAALRAYQQKQRVGFNNPSVKK